MNRQPLFHRNRHRRQPGSSHVGPFGASREWRNLAAYLASVSFVFSHSGPSVYEFALVLADWVCLVRLARTTTRNASPSSDTAMMTPIEIPTIAPVLRRLCSEGGSCPPLGMAVVLGS